MVTPFSSDQYIVLLLIFLLGALLGMFLTTGRKWKRKYKDEVRRREAMEAEHKHAEALAIAAKAKADRPSRAEPTRTP